MLKLSQPVRFCAEREFIPKGGLQRGSMRILVIEDEPRMLELLRRGLQEHDCAVMTAMDGETGLEIASGCEFDVIVLDIGLPRCNGYDVIQILRERSSKTRVLMLTARDGEDDIIRGLELGADDYLTKPFSFPEFVARLQSITREPRRDLNCTIQAGDLAVNPIKRSVSRGNQKIELSRSEFNLLLPLVRSAGLCVSRQSLMECVWGANPDVGSGALDVLVNSLRSKIDASNRPKLIHTVRGSGYLLSNSWHAMERARL
jgi:DNA-binding response OmpR family regulator